ncbi:hypothetical protein wTpre_1427 [Wolbachia endosymbiont of Trichogramma pretiosum]|nr:hypothetical protein wTpre_1427 [Wolbachia endosymbiont of Trichogramma pretiosum]
MSNICVTATKFTRCLLKNDVTSINLLQKRGNGYKIGGIARE